MSESFCYFYDLMPFHNNSNPKPMLRLGVLSHQWEQWMVGCIDWYALLHNWTTDRKPIQALLDHNDLKTTMCYLHVSNRHIQTIENLLDALLCKHKKPPT